ncbi:enoyl-CoA hydratase-related protein [Spirillospora sp. NPDC048911]|uniref:enoyl-CoA hydratase-related protein n=1 Tax=Spirillospora sp. NPDC048911 TaxID=3364527 RepID=UPI00371D8D3F
MPLQIEYDGTIQIITIDRPDRRNAVDGPMADELREAFAAFEASPGARVAVLTGAGGTFCAGNDLKAIAAGDFPAPTIEGPPPMQVTRRHATKPVVAAIEGYCFGGGFELALWADLRIASTTAEFGLLNLGKGLPCLDGATVRLPRIVGHGRAMELILTGRRLAAAEALTYGLVSKVVDAGQALPAAVTLAAQIAATPPEALQTARRSALDQWSLSESAATSHETELALS